MDGLLSKNSQPSKKEINIETLTVLKFSTPDGANQMLDKIKSLQKMELIK